MLPDDIIRESFRIIDREAGAHGFTAEEWPIVRRMIHASGDIELVRAVAFQHDAARKGLAALQNKATLIADANMVAVGINKSVLETLGAGMLCFIDAPEAKRLATSERTTRSYASMKLALARFPEAVYVIGNAPTALMAICEAVRAGQARPALLLAMPVGFVGVLESKAQALSLDVPVIAVQGRKGGSAVAAAAMNALLLMALEEKGT